MPDSQAFDWNLVARSLAAIWKLRFYLVSCSGNFAWNVAAGMFAGRDFGGNQASGICDDIRQQLGFWLDWTGADLNGDHSAINSSLFPISYQVDSDPL